MSVAAKCYVVVIEGWADEDGQVKMCYPTVPDYATAQYGAILREPPKGVGSRWDPQDQKASTGRVTMVLSAGVPVLMRSNSQPVNSLYTVALVGDSSLQLKVDPSAALAVNQAIYSDTETMQITSVTASPAAVGVTRGFGGSTAAQHAVDSLIYIDAPPTFVGREVIIYEVDRVGSSAGAEVEIARGFVSAPPAAGLHEPTITIVERFGSALLDESPDDGTFNFTWHDGAPLLNQSWNIDLDTGNAVPFPRFHQSGGYWWLPQEKMCFIASYSTTLGWEPGRVIAGKWPAMPSGGEYEESFGLQIVSSLNDGTNGARDGNYNVFGYDSTISSNPAHIALNLLVSTAAGGNATGGGRDYDRPTLAPDFALGVPIARVDETSFERMAEALTGIEANMLFLGVTQESFDDVFWRLLAPWGYTIGTNRKGHYVALSIKDSYAGESVLAITDANMVNIQGIRQYAKARPLDSILIECDPWPDGSSGHPIKVSNPDGSTIYPSNNGVRVGKQQQIKNAPYRNKDFDQLSRAYSFVANRMRLLASQVAFVDVELAPSAWNTADIGDIVTITTKAIRLPETGARMTTADTALDAIVTTTAADFGKRTTKVTLMLLPSRKVGKIAPSGRVGAWDSGTKTMTLQGAEFSGAVDAATFSVGDSIVLLDEHSVLRSDEGNDYPTYIKSISGNDIVIASTPSGSPAAFRDSGGSSVTPNTSAPADVITFAHFDDCKDNGSSTQLDFAFSADGGARGSTSTLGDDSDISYKYGI